ncbi:MAG: hypothetical protein IJ012_00250 [Clostridia bacterium]|nr:hypothetical protein [Clostridia bacterium]
MQDFVEKFIREREELLNEARAGIEGNIAEEREARLIRLGMCRKEYNPALTYAEEYPYQEYKTGKYYRLVAFEVSDEEYEAICRYDDNPVARQTKTVGDKFLGKSPKKLRRAAVCSWLFGTLAAILAGVLLYLADSQYLLVSLFLALFGSLFSHFAATQFFAVANMAEKLDYLLAEQEKKK